MQVWGLGADFADNNESQPTKRARAIGEAPRPFFLSVGTLAPNKGQALSLVAFEHLWAAGVDVAFVIVGRGGWATLALQRRLRGHAEWGRRLFWFDDASDAELQYFYRHARAVICASLDEGFGLPLVEAARAGAPVIASDIEIFHEVAGDAVSYFELLDASALALRIEETLHARKSSGPLATLSWTQSMLELYRVLDDLQTTTGQSGGEHACIEENK